MEVDRWSHPNAALMTQSNPRSITVREMSTLSLAWMKIVPIQPISDDPIQPTLHYSARDEHIEPGMEEILSQIGHLFTSQANPTGEQYAVQKVRGGEDPGENPGHLFTGQANPTGEQYAVQKVVAGLVAIPWVHDF